MRKLDTLTSSCLILLALTGLANAQQQNPAGESGHPVLLRSEACRE